MTDARASSSKRLRASRKQTSLTEKQIREELERVEYLSDEEYDISDSDKDYVLGSDQTDSDMESESEEPHHGVPGSAIQARSSVSDTFTDDIEHLGETDGNTSFQGFSDQDASDTSADNSELCCGVRKVSSKVARGGGGGGGGVAISPPPSKVRGVSRGEHSVRVNTSVRLCSRGSRAARVKSPGLAARGCAIARGRASSRDRDTRTRDIATDTFVWNSGDDFVPNIPIFDHTDSGVTDTFVVENEECEMDYFKAYFDDELMQHIVRETNRWAASVIDDEDLPPHSRMTRWKETNVEELYVFMALSMMMAHGKKAAMHEYWNKDAVVPTPIFNKYMSRDRWFILHRCIHFEDNEITDKSDRLWKVRHIFQALNNKYRSFYHPTQKLVIDESLMLFKGRISFRQYIPSKRHRWGLKLFILCDCETGLVIQMILYTGTDIDVKKNDPHGFSGSVVKTLMEPLFNKGHILYTDNYYTSPTLSSYLLEKNTATCGTVKALRKKMPVFDHRIGVGDCQLRHTDNMLVLKWKDKREVYMLTTIHKGNMVDSGKVNHYTRENVFKPDAVLDYNINMRLVDKCDMMIGAVECVRKCSKWYKKFFFHLIDITMLNAYNMFLVKTGVKSTMRTFSGVVISQLLMKYGKEKSQMSGRNIASPTMRHTLPNRLVGKEVMLLHVSEYLPPVGKRARSQRECYVCKNTERRDKKRKLTTTWCKECNVALCYVDCFRDYHTLQKF